MPGKFLPETPSFRPNPGSEPKNTVFPSMPGTGTLYPVICMMLYMYDGDGNCSSQWLDAADPSRTYMYRYRYMQCSAKTNYQTKPKLH